MIYEEFLGLSDKGRRVGKVLRCLLGAGADVNITGRSDKHLFHQCPCVLFGS